MTSRSVNTVNETFAPTLSLVTTADAVEVTAEHSSSKAYEDGAAANAELLAELQPGDEAASESEAIADESTDYASLMVSGALWAIGGTVVTAVTYEAAQDGGMYVVAWGAILFGAFDFLRGLAGMAFSQAGE